jgi:hypothetical protein
MAFSHLFVEPRPKMMVMMIIMGYEYLWGTVWVGSLRRGRGKGQEREGRMGM